MFNMVIGCVVILFGMLLLIGVFVLGKKVFVNVVIVVKDKDLFLCFGC